MYEHTFAPNGGCFLSCLSNIFATSGENVYELLTAKEYKLFISFWLLFTA